MVSSTRTSVTQQRDDEEVGEPALVLDRCPSAFPDEQRVHVGVIERPHDVGGPVDAEHRVALEASTSRSSLGENGNLQVLDELGPGGRRVGRSLDDPQRL